MLNGSSLAESQRPSHTPAKADLQPHAEENLRIGAGSRQEELISVREILGALIVGLASATGLHAQTVLGTVVEVEFERPVGGAFVLLLDESGEVHDRYITTANGTFRLNAGSAGVYQLRLQRIGFDDAESAWFAVPQGGTVSRRLTIQSVPIRLSTIRVDGRGGSDVEPRCGRPTGEMKDLSRLWNEVEKALQATAWTQERSRYRFDKLLIRQVRNVGGKPLTKPEYKLERVRGRHAFRAVQPDFLASEGWVQKYVGGEMAYFGPDAETLLAESFLRTHCFRIVHSDSASRRIIGIGFEPLAGHRRTDISGVLWVDRASAKLLSLEFQYEKLPIRVKSDRLGGSIEFDHLPDGGWIVQSWEIRTPLAEVERLALSNRIRLKGIHHEGWRVLAVRHADGRETILRRYPSPPGAPEPTN